MNAAPRNAHTAFAASRAHRLAALLMALALVVALAATVPGEVAAGQPGPLPTVGAIVVDDYDCASGVIAFHVSVTDLPSVPDGTSGFDFPLTYRFESFYAVGSSEFQTRPMVYSPTAAQSPYTGRVDLALTVPTTNVSGAPPGTGAITRIDLTVAVGYGGFQMGAFDSPTDVSELTYQVDCDGEEPTLVEQLIAVLIRILQQILGW